MTDETSSPAEAVADGAPSAPPPPTGVDPDLIGRGNDGIGAFLAGRGAQSHLVSSAAFREALPRDASGAFTWSETLDGVPPTARTLHLESPDAEAALLREAAARFPDRKLLGVRTHVAPMIATDRQPLKSVPADWRPAELRGRYLIACPARSGSTLLGQMLTQVGLGKPREHLRTPLAAALRAPGVDRTEAWRQVAWRAKEGGIFGSKLVAEFMNQASGAGTMTELLGELAADDVPVIALRRPLIQTAVSRYVARQADQWHVKGTLSQEERQRFAGATYAYETLLGVVNKNRAENLALAAAVAALPPARVLAVDYADLEARPRKVVERIAEFTGLPAKLGALNFDHLPVKISGSVDVHARIMAAFVADAREQGDDPGDLDG